MRARVTLCAIVALLACAIGAALGALATRPVRPAALADPVAAGTVPVSWRRFDDARTLEVRTTRSPPVTLVAPGAGRITTWDCAPGTRLTSGASTLSIDGEPVVSLATDVALWRDLHPGDSGADVEAVQRALAALGAQVRVDGLLGPETVVALDGFRTAGPAGRPAIEVASLLWLPGVDVEVGTCEASTGQTVGDGDALATTVGVLRSVALALVPTDAAAGPRTLTVDGVRLSLDADGTQITDPSSLTALAATDSFSAHAAAPESIPLHGAWALATPLDVAAIPPGSVFDISGSRGCATSEGNPVPVEIVASDLGQTLVTFPAGDDPEAVDTTPAAGARCP